MSTRFKVRTGKGRGICDLAQLEFIYKVFIIRYDICILVDLCMYYKEVLSVWIREGRDICESAQHRFI